MTDAGEGTPECEKHNLQTCCFCLQVCTTTAAHSKNPVMHPAMAHAASEGEPFLASTPPGALITLSSVILPQKLVKLFFSTMIGTGKEAHKAILK